jgi:histone deacetylase HOS3
VISVLEGGYSDRALSSGVLSHLSGLAGGDPMEVKTEINHSGLGYEMATKAGAFNGALVPETVAPVQPYDASWWALPQLEQLDATVNPPAPPPEPKKPKDAPPPTYFSPTQSFSAKIVGSPKPQRSVSGLSTANGSSPRLTSRAPSPPPPDVYWATAAHELSKLLSKCTLFSESIVFFVHFRKR